MLIQKLQQQKDHVHATQKTITQTKLRQTKARFSRLLQHHSWKWSRSILKGKDKDTHKQ